MRNKTLLNLHFYISIPTVIVVALVYGFKPNWLLDIQPKTTDELNVYKAIMGIYLAFASFWCLALIQNQYWKTATVSNILFMLGLAFGRLLSFALDGMPSLLLVFGCFGELTLALYAYYLLKRRAK